MSLPRVAVVCDLVEEEWPSMELVADQLINHLNQDYAEVVTATRVCPPMRRRLSRGPGEQGKGERGKRFNADRVLNRFWDYPRFVRSLKLDFDLFHVMDHSYGQLLHELPTRKTIVTCHDLDTFQCLLNPEQEPRSIFFRKMMQRTLNGFRKAAFVTCDSVSTRDELLAHDLVSAERTAVIPNGVHPSCSPEANAAADAAAAKLLERFQMSDVRYQRSDRSQHKADARLQTGDGRDLSSELRTQNSELLLHVGSTIPRKRIDVLLHVFAKVRELFPGARLLRVGGAFTAEQTVLVQKLGLCDSILVLPRIDRDVLAAVYRRASLVLQPSEREGFGLPVVEAMACGTPLVASDLPVLREVGGEAAVYCAVGNVDAWTEAIAQLLESRGRRSEVGGQRSEIEKRREAGLAQAAKFSWAEYARLMVGVYERVLSEE